MMRSIIGEVTFEEIFLGMYPGYSDMKIKAMSNAYSSRMTPETLLSILRRRNCKITLTSDCITVDMWHDK